MNNFFCSRQRHFAGLELPSESPVIAAREQPYVEVLPSVQEVLPSANRGVQPKGRA